ncbi:UNVERIFIED_CONTAM: hypothetical protein HDU68_006688 [Siphonaria sp. JEL0065]|nr:hypothetical protein HDU68_006688 [Siphonaria sp. JEL0065]
MTSKQPTYFLAHGNPLWLIEKTGAGPTFLKALGKQILKSPVPPKTILMVSAHWETSPAIRVTTTEKHTLLYDYYGFPKEFYNVKYPVEGDPVVANEAIELLKKAGFKVQAETERGLDHGAFTPLLYMFPNQELPVVQVSLPSTNKSEDYYRLGQALAPLRSQGVLIIGGGYLLHNLRLMIPKLTQNPQETDPKLPWAEDFVNATRKAVLENAGGSERKNAVLGLFKRESYFTAHPTPEHFAPLVVAAGAAADRDDKADLVHEYWLGGIEAQDSFRFGDLPTAGFAGKGAEL